MTRNRTATSEQAARPPRSDRRARRFARLWRLMERSVDEQIRPAKTAILTDLPDEIVEIGPGRGANFAYYEPGTRVVACEPNPYFHDVLRAAAEERGLQIELHPGDLRSAGLPDASQDVVVSTLVMCSVDGTADLLDEVARVLRPGGRLLFVEHVAAPAGTARARFQRLVRRPWKAIGDGCDPCADTAERLAGSGLDLTDTRHEDVGSRLDPTSLVYWGVARRQ